VAVIPIRSELRQRVDLALRHAIVDDRERGIFKVRRDVFVDEAVLEIERRAIFDRCWLYIAHTSELPGPSTFVTRKVGGRELLLTRDREGRLHAFFNTCSHRGAKVCREASGRRTAFACGYHGWVYDGTGKLVDVPGRESMSPGQIECGALDLTPVPRLDEHCGFIFVCFDQDAMSLADYLADAKEVLEIISQQGPQGMEIVRGEQAYCISANWKLLLENSIDSYHVHSTHATYLDYLNARDREGQSATIDPQRAEGRARDLGHGHAVLESDGANAWGRPCARWVAGWGEEARVEIDAMIAELSGRLGETRARVIANGDRNIGIFPNLVVNDVMSLTVRTFYPVRPDYIEVNAWALAPKGESDSSRDRRLRSFLEFLGPAGFATPDDVEMLELCQKGYSNLQGAQWNDISRGMLKEVPGKADEHQMRTFWRRWHELTSGFEAAAGAAR
jgi:p-cumate 2,3-dioxygenase alpha subunit